jgi:hypothetical protein
VRSGAEQGTAGIQAPCEERRGARDGGYYPAQLVLRLLVVHFDANKELALHADVLDLLLAVPAHAADISRLKRENRGEMRGATQRRCNAAQKQSPWCDDNLSGDGVLQNGAVRASARSKSSSKFRRRTKLTVLEKMQSSLLPSSLCTVPFNLASWLSKERSMVAASLSASFTPPKKLLAFDPRDCFLGTASPPALISARQTP